jgi:2-C-methyl-D-erythritol 2,4-cyclodiphosphate synthase
MDLLRQVVDMLDERGCTILNVDCVVAMQSPKLAPYREAMIVNLARTIGVDVDRVTVRATTTDHLGFVGRREGAASIAACLVLRGAENL